MTFIPEDEYQKILKTMPVFCGDFLIFAEKKYLLIKRREEPVKDVCKSIIDFFEETNICQDENGFMCKKEGMTGFPPRVDKNIKNSTDIGMSFNLSGHYINQMIMKSLAKHTRNILKIILN